MAYIGSVEPKLDRDGELEVEIPTSMDEDVTLYIRESDLLNLVAPFGYSLLKSLPPPPVTEGDRR